MNEAKDAANLPPLFIQRRFAAPRALVFKAWSSAAHIKRWFSPETYCVPDAEIDFRPGGAFNLCMRSPAGEDSWMRGTFGKIEHPARLEFDGKISFGGTVRFATATAVTFEDIAGGAGGTSVSVRQSYIIFDPAFLGAARGAPEGWRGTLDKLVAEVARIAAAGAAPAVHSTFSVERIYPASPAQVFHALTDQTAKSRWFGANAGCTVVKHEMDVREGGRECLIGHWPDGSSHRFEASYFDVVPFERLVYAYEMTMGETKISVSLATLELKSEVGGTRLKVTEQGVFLDGYEDGGSREHGTGWLLDELGAALT